MSWRRIVVLVAVLVFVALLGFGLTRDPSLIASPLVGAPAPDFRLEQLDGGPTVGLQNLRGQVVVVNFWASWCLACKEEHPALVRAWQRYKGEHVRMVGIVYQDTPENARKYLKEHGGGWTQLVDPKSRVAINFGVYGVPETFFIGPAGVVAQKHIGPVTDSILSTQIDSLLMEVGEGS